MHTTPTTKDAYRYIEGKLESLATKELVLQLNANLLEVINRKIDQQTRELRAEIQSFDRRITDQDKKYTKLAGAAVAIGLILSLVVGAANAFATAVSAGLLQIG